MEPFFVMTNVGSEISEEEVRDAMERSTPGQLDNIAVIMMEAYNEDIYEYARVSPDPDAASPFLALADALNAGFEARWGYNVAPYASLLSDLRIRYVAETAVVTGNGARSGNPAPLTGISPPTAALQFGGPELDIEVWPNPATKRITVRTSETVAMIRVYDMAGRRIAQLPVSSQASGSVAVWDLSEASGARVAPGRYQIVVDGAARRSVSVTVL